MEAFPPPVWAKGFDTNVINMIAAQSTAMLQSRFFLMMGPFRGGVSAMREPKFARKGAGVLTVGGASVGYAIFSNLELHNWSL